jgi:ribose 5-phosphate isomerase B
MITISIGSDHAGFKTKAKIVTFLKKHGFEINDHGTFSEDSVDYPDYIHPVAFDTENGRSDYGIALCGSGNGAAITANKHQNIRAAICWNTELAILARQHNDANILVIPARFVSSKLALEMVKAFLNTGFEGGRHQKRIDKIPLI